MKKTSYKMEAKVWLYPGINPWHFISIPKKQAEEIRKNFGSRHRGWSSLPVIVQIGKTIWKTSIFYERRSGTYILPLKSEVRKKEDIFKGDKISFLIQIKV